MTYLTLRTNNNYYKPTVIVYPWRLVLVTEYGGTAEVTLSEVDDIKIILYWLDFAGFRRALSKSYRQSVCHSSE